MIEIMNDNWKLYSRKFIEKGLSGDVSYEMSSVKNTFLGGVTYSVQSVIFILMSIPCRIFIIDQFCEFIATNWGRGIVGFLLRGIYWKTKMGSMGQNVFIDRWVSICPSAKNVYLGNNIHIESHVSLQTYQGLLIVGDGSQILSNCYLNCRPFIILGEDVSIGNNCTLYAGSIAIMDERGRKLPWSSMDDANHRDLLCGIIFEDHSGLEINVVCSPDPWEGKGIDRKLTNKTLIVGKHTGICSNSYIDKSTGELEMWAGNPAKMIFDYKPIVELKLAEGENLLEFVD
jgi:acetyltransferase-like isoleucine patch superfamily enzyme